MITRKDLKICFALFRFYSFINFHPTEVNVNECRLRFIPTGAKATVYKLIFCMVTAYYAFVTVQLVRVVLDSSMFVAEHFPLHLMCLAFAYICIFQAYIVFISNPESTTVLLKEICNFPEGSPGESLRKHFKGLRSWSIQDLVLVSFPSTIVSTSFVMLLMFLSDPNRAQLLYSLLSTTYRNPWTLGACLVIDYYCLLFLHASAGFSIFFQLCFFNKATAEIHDKWNTSRQEPARLAMRLRNLQTLVTLFNENVHMVVFGLKQFCICMFVLQASYGLVYLSKNALIGVYCLGIAFDAAASYVVLYDHAFAIPVKVEDIKQDILLSRMRKIWRNPTDSDALETAILKKTLRSVPRLAVKVGNFGYMEQNSTPDFLDFITNQTAGLLISLSS